MKQVVQDKLGCGPNFKYHYRLDKDMYEGYALPHRLPQQVWHPPMAARPVVPHSRICLTGPTLTPRQPICMALLLSQGASQARGSWQSRIHAHLHARGSCLRPVGVAVRDQRGLPGLPYGTSNALWLERPALACI